jgi:amino acid permease
MQVGWIAAIVLLLKSQIGLGVLSVPAAFNTLGLAPGIILLLLVAAITTWTGYVIGTFKLNHPSVYGIDDAGQIMFGRIGREFLATAFCLYWLFVSGSAMLGVSIGLNAVSTHGTCTAVFVAVAAVIGLAFASVRTLGRMSWLAWVGTTCVLVSSKSHGRQVVISVPKLTTRQSSLLPLQSVYRIAQPMLLPKVHGPLTGKSSATRPLLRLCQLWLLWFLRTVASQRISPLPPR